MIQNAYHSHYPLEPYYFIVPPHEPGDDTVTPVEDPRKPKSPVKAPLEEDNEAEDPRVIRPALDNDPDTPSEPESDTSKAPASPS